MFGSYTITHTHFVMILLSLTHCVDQVNGDEENKPPDGVDGSGSAFFALRSCHQLLSADTADFFSPDYVCANPSLWCNWTIQVDPGKRIHLYLEDLTPDDACPLKRDQIHVDEPTSRFGIHKILQKCWREVKFTTTSNTLTVVLLISGRPDSPYRGFYGRYQAFGPPVLYVPKDVTTVRDQVPEPDPGSVKVGAAPVIELTKSVFSPSPVTTDHSSYDHRSAMMAERPGGAADTDPELDKTLENLGHMYPLTAVPTVPRSPEVSGPSNGSASNAVTPKPHEQSRELKATDRIPGAKRRNVEQASSTPGDATSPEDATGPKDPDGPKDPAGPENSDGPEDPAGPENSEGPEDPPGPEDSAGLQVEGGPNIQTEVDRAAEAEPKPEVTEVSDRRSPHPNVVEPLSDHRRNSRVQNQSEVLHLPGDHLYEVSVEVNLSPPVDERWDSETRSLLLNLKSLVSERLSDLVTSVSTKRIKRLNAGVLFIFWLQTQKGAGHRVHSAVQSLGGASLDLGHRGALIVSVSTADVNECGTQLVLCDVNAECVNQFGSYSCRCRPDFLDASRLGSGGTACVRATGHGVSAETRGVYVLFFLLSALLLLLLAAAAVLYRRQRRGSFLLRCRGDHPPRPDDHRDLPPPPPPPRAPPREDWSRPKRLGSGVDLPLLHFHPLPPPPGGVQAPRGPLEPRPGGA